MCKSFAQREGGNNVSKWKSSEAKQWLKESLLDAKHHYWNDSPGEVYDHNYSFFHLYKYENFRTNLRALKNKTTAEQTNS